jgi:hypothetical protein
MRDFLVFLHVLSAAAWIGGSLYAMYAYSRITSVGGSGAILKAVSERGGRYYGSSAGLTLLTGILLVLTQDPWGWGDLFVIIGLSVFAFSAVYQPLIATKTEERLLAAAAGDGDVTSALRSFYGVTGLELAVLLFALYAMVAKLGT